MKDPISNPVVLWTNRLAYAFTFFALALIIIIVSACSQDEPDPVEPVTEFEIQITSPSDTAYVKGVVNIEAMAPEETPVASAKVYVDNALITETTGETISVSWDSKTVADGSHVIKVVALDATGKESTAELTIHVLNTFVILNIPPNYFPAGEKVVIFISNNDGNPVYASEAENDTQLVIETPPGLSPDSELVLSIFVQRSLSENITSYSEFSPGTYSLKRPLEFKDAGSHQITVTSLPLPSSLLGVYSNGTEGETNILQSTEATVTATLATTTADVLLSLATSEQHEISYRLLENVQVGGHTTLDVNTFVPMNLQEAASSAQAIFSMSEVVGLADADDDRSAVHVSETLAATGFGDPSKFRMFYPGNLFPKYVFTNVFSGANFGHQIQSVGATPPATVTPIDANLVSVKHENGIVTVTTDGTCDYTLLNAFSNPSTGRSFSWHLHVAAGTNQSVTVPKVPNEVKALTTNKFENLQFKTGIITDYETLDNYQAYLQFMLNTPDKLYLSFKEKNIN